MAKESGRALTAKLQELPTQDRVRELRVHVSERARQSTLKHHNTVQLQGLTTL